MKNEEFQLLIDMSKEMAVNTAATINIEAHLKELNGKTLKNQEAITATNKEVSKLKSILFIGMVVVGMLFINNARDFINFIKIIL